MEDAKIVTETNWREMTPVELAKSNINFTSLNLIDDPTFSKTMRKIMLEEYAKEVALINMGDQDTIEFYADLEKKRREDLEKNKQ